jgi:hypothetical protein
VGASVALSTETTALPEGSAGSRYTVQLQARGGVAPYSWSTESPLPPGLRLIASGLLCGNITAAPTAYLGSDYQRLSFVVSDARGARAATPPMVLTVAAEPLAILTTSCPGGKQYTRYAGCTIRVRGGSPPYRFVTPTGSAGYRDRRYCSDVTGLCAGLGHGGLPEGIVLDVATGVLSSPGAIAGMGTYAPHIIVTDAKQAVVQTNQLTLAIAGDSTLGGCELFPADSIFHTRLTELPVDTSPAAAIGKQYLQGRIHALFGTEGGKAPTSTSFGHR